MVNKKKKKARDLSKKSGMSYQAAVNALDAKSPAREPNPPISAAIPILWGPPLPHEELERRALDLRTLDEVLADEDNIIEQRRPGARADVEGGALRLASDIGKAWDERHVRKLRAEVLQGEKALELVCHGRPTSTLVATFFRGSARDPLLLQDEKRTYVALEVLPEMLRRAVESEIGSQRRSREDRTLQWVEKELLGRQLILPEVEVGNLEKAVPTYLSAWAKDPE